MNTTEIRSTLAELAQTELRLEGALPEGDLADQLDSMQRLTLVVAIEDRFLICFEPEDEVGVVTLQDLVATIQIKLQERPSE
jgi:acyl carrier protein